jgi:hypothetical protein
MLQDFCANSVLRLTSMKVSTGCLHGNFRIAGHPAITLWMVVIHCNTFAAYDSCMLPCLPRNLRIALLVIFVCCALQLKAAASAERGKEGPGGAHLLPSGRYGTGIPLASVRYHFGDDPHWADPGFDDQSWPTVEQGRWPVPAFNSDGFMWARARVTVPSDAAGPIALCLSQNTSQSRTRFL